MNRYARVLALVGCLIVAVGRADTHESALLSALLDLGRLNGEALACGAHDAAARAKALVLAYAPKVRRYGAAYEQGTQEAFSTHVRESSTCRPEATVLGDIERAGVMIRLALERDTTAEANSP